MTDTSAAHEAAAALRHADATREPDPGKDVCLVPRSGETATDVLDRVTKAARAEFELEQARRAR